MEKTDLSIYDNSWFNDGACKLKIKVWYMVNTLFFNCGWNISNGLKIRLLKLFGAKIGKGVVIKTHVNIKYPWRLSIGDYVWIGEYSWIDNMVEVALGNNSVLSQGAMILCGNHDYKKVTFDLMPGKIIIDEGAWVGARSIVCPGVTMYSHSVLAVGSVATRDCEAYGIYQGNPAEKIKERIID